MATWMALIVFAFLIYACKGKSKEEKAEPYQPTTETLEKRADLTPLIDEWVIHCREKRSRRSILDWKFVNYESYDRILVMFKGDDKYVEGKLSFTYDHDCPRVSRFTYEEDGETRYVRGVSLPILSHKVLCDGFRATMVDVSRINYINEVAERAMRNGKAIFDICKYENITKEQFKELFGPREIRAFCQAISEGSGFNLSYENKTGKFIMRPVFEPELEDTIEPQEERI